MVFSIIMLVCLIVCVGIDYLSLKRIERNGALLGVTLPQNAAELPEVQDIVQRYLRRLRTICLLCAAVSVGCFSRPIRCFMSRSGSISFSEVWLCRICPVCGQIAPSKGCGMPTAGPQPPEMSHGNTVCSIMLLTTRAPLCLSASARGLPPTSPPSGGSLLWRSMPLQSLPSY